MTVLGEYPKAVPNVVPDREEAGRGKLTKVRRNACRLKGAYYYEVEQEVNGRNKDVAFSNFCLVLAELLAVKDPVTLQ